MTGTVLALALLATYSLTLLLIYDRVTKPLRAWLHRFGHTLGPMSLDGPSSDPNARARAYCECGHAVGPVAAYGYAGSFDDVRSTAHPQGESILAELHDTHVAEANTTGWRYLLGCPWCASAWIGALVVASALAWGNGWGWQLIAGTLAVRAATGLLSTIAHPSGD